MPAIDADNNIYSTQDKYHFHLEVAYMAEIASQIRSVRKSMMASHDLPLYKRVRFLVLIRPNSIEGTQLTDLERAIFP